MEGAKDSGGGSIGIREDVCRLGGIVLRFSYRQTKAWRGDEAGNLKEWQSAWLVPLKLNPKKAL